MGWRGYVRPVTLGVLAVVSIGLMLFMVRRAAQRPAPPPSAEELAGVPPTLSSEEGDEMVGEAGEVEPPLPGMELDEDTLRQRKITEQVSEMIKNDPEEVGLVFSRLARRNE
jgi:flagellar biosynthesis/type III secretory pathway M-ring protein FliF/YscJ